MGHFPLWDRQRDNSRGYKSLGCGRRKLKEFMLENVISIKQKADQLLRERCGWVGYELEGQERGYPWEYDREWIKGLLIGLDEVVATALLDFSLTRCNFSQQGLTAWERQAGGKTRWWGVASVDFRSGKDKKTQNQGIPGYSKGCVRTSTWKNPWVGISAFVLQSDVKTVTDERVKKKQWREKIKNVFLSSLIYSFFLLINSFNKPLHLHVKLWGEKADIRSVR